VRPRPGPARSRPAGRQITLALAKLPSTGDPATARSLFLDPGGPGGSGVDLRDRLDEAGGEQP
jgi:hypothetical protein